MSDDVNDINPIGHGHLLREPVWRLSLRPYHLALDWTVPASVPDTLGGNFVTGFNIYRCGPGSGDCTPSSVIATLPANQYSYADTSVQSGQTYCYAVTYLHSDSCTTSESPLSNIACGQICTNGCPQPEILITGNNAVGCRTNDEYGSGALETYDFGDGSLVHWFIPSGAVDGVLGRGLAIYNGNIYYTEVLGPANYPLGYAPTPNVIHICSYGTEGSGPSPVQDSGTISNPDQRHDQNGDYSGIQDLAFQTDPKTGVKELFVLSGYGHWQPEVSEIDPTTGNLILNGSVPNGQVLIGNPASVRSDGFAVLTINGALYFLINEDDGSPVYDKYDTSGAKVAGWVELS